MRIDIALQGRLAEPAGRLSLVRRNILAGLIGKAHLVLGIHVANLGKGELLVEWQFLQRLGRGGCGGQKENREDGERVAHAAHSN